MTITTQDILDGIAKAKARSAELHEIRLAPGGLQDQLHTLLEKTLGAEGDPRIISLRAAIKALQAEKFEHDMVISAAVKAAGPLNVMQAAPPTLPQ
jgi:hypothetical protein